MTERLIKKIEIDQLYGQYSYTMPAQRDFSNAAILYGDNGVGKSTILRLVFHLLSAANNKGHRGALINVPFRRLVVELTSGITFIAERIQKSIDVPSIVLSIRKDKNTIAEWSYSKESKDSPSRLIEHDGDLYFVNDDGSLELLETKQTQKRPSDLIRRGEAPYLEALAEHAPTMFYVNAERRLDSDSIADPSDEIELRRVVRMEDTRRINDLVARSREIALTQALSTASRWIQRKAVFSANQGSTNVHSVYINVLRHLAGAATKGTDHPHPTDLNALKNQIDKIAEKTAQLAKYELATQLDIREFRKSLNVGAMSRRQLAAGVLNPYIESLEGRLEALEPLYDIVHKFVTTINRFLTGKAISYKLSSGFTITSQIGTRLAASQLSSGEQQLLLMFCYALIARDHPSVFMIDEPELSLNIKWQRQLLQSLIEITEGEKIQFILASHSLELIAQHRSRVVRLVA